ncbi:MAG: HDOD domain-containing protein [Gammaproteobacteria bacterium]
MKEPSQTELDLVKSLPALPISAQKILRAFRDEEPDIYKIVDAIAIDPGVTTKLLAIANSAYYQTRRPCHSVRDAIVRLGLDEVKKLLLPVVISEQFDTKRCKNFRGDLYWKQALMVACAAKNIAEQTKSNLHEITASAAHVAGLLHNIGLIAMVHVFPDEMENIFNSVSEFQQYKLAHLKDGELNPGIVGTLLLHAWDIPEEISSIPHASHPLYDERIEGELSELIRFSINWYEDKFSPVIHLPSFMIQADVIPVQLQYARRAVEREKNGLVKFADMLFYY